MTEYRKDPETGHVYADGGIYGIRTLDDQRSEREDFKKMQIRRANITRRQLTFSERLALTRHEYESIEEITRRRLSEFPSRTRSRTHTPTRTRSADASPVGLWPQPSSRFHSPRRQGSDRPGWMQATESFDFIEPSTGKRVHIKAGSYADPKCSAVAARPGAWAA
jgi:hypothetical protein